MGERGPKGKPTQLRILDGDRKDRINFDEPLPAEAEIVPPTPLPDEAQSVWDRLAPDLIAKGVLTAWDVDQFAAFCRAVATYNRAAFEFESGELTARGAAGGVTVPPAYRIMNAAASEMRSTGSRFGLTPSDRAALKVEPVKKTDDAKSPDRFFG